MEPEDATDSELVGRCCANRAELQDSFRELYGRHSGAVFHYLCALVGRDRASDALQETFLRIYRNLDRYEGSRPFRAWAMGVARNVGLDTIRREGVRQTAPLVEEPPVQRRTPYEQVSQREEDELLRRAIGELPPPERAVFLLRQVEGLSYREVAHALGIAERTAQYRMKQASERLAHALRRRGLLPGGAE